VVRIRKEVISFRQLEEESLGTSWYHFNELIITGPDLAIQDPILLQYFYMGLSKDSMEFLDIASRGAFLHLSTSEAMAMLDRISGKLFALAFIMNSPRKRRNHLPIKKRKF
jgi:hypothetical protein